MEPQDFPHASWFTAAYSEFRNAGLDPALFTLDRLCGAGGDPNEFWTAGYRHRGNPRVEVTLRFRTAPETPSTVKWVSLEYRP